MRYGDDDLKNRGILNKGEEHMEPNRVAVSFIDGEQALLRGVLHQARVQGVF